MKGMAWFYSGTFLDNSLADIYSMIYFKVKIIINRSYCVLLQEYVAILFLKIIYIET